MAMDAFSELTPVGNAASNTACLVMDLTGEMQGTFGALNVIDSGNKALQVLGFSGSLAALMGPISTYNGWKEVKVSHRYEDLWGVLRGGGKLMTGSLQTAGGIAFAGMSIATIQKFATAAKTASAAATRFASAGMGIMAGAALCGLLTSFINLSYLTSARAKLHRFEKKGQDPLEQICKECASPIESLNWRRVLGEKLFHKVTSSKGASLSEIKERFRSDYASALVNLTLQIAGITLSALAVVASGTVAPWAIGVAGALLGLIALVLDGHSFVETMNGKEEAAWWEKGVMYVSALFCLAITASGLYLAEDLISILLTSILGVVLAGIHMYGFSKMRSNGADC